MQTLAGAQTQSLVRDRRTRIGSGGMGHSEMQAIPNGSPNFHIGGGAPGACTHLK